MEQQEKIAIKNEMRREIQNVIKSYSHGGAFLDRKITDTPTDSYAVVNRRFVTLNGTLASRPSSAVVGQHYFATDTNIPMVFDGTNWRNGIGSVVASG